MQYVSTRDSRGEEIGAAVAIVRGIAPDGGLYVPCEFPRYFPLGLPQKSYIQLAYEIFSLYLDDFSPGEILSIAEAAYGRSFPSQVVPCLNVGPFTLLELFHGPTAAFKDIALQALPHFLTSYLAKTGLQREVIILVATSGDTGKAALEGFKDVEGCRVVVFYPAGGVSEMQERQMLTTGGRNTHVLAVRGNFDDCQNGVKRIFADTALAAQLKRANMSFSSANSINFGRLLPQIVYYYYAYGQLAARGQLKMGRACDIAVPTGNFGNILAAYYARRMGLPVRRLICASNENDVLREAIENGVYNRLRPFHKTASPSMDILVSSNFERFLFEMYGREAALCAGAMQQFSSGGSLSIEPRQKWQNLLLGGAATGEEAARTLARVFAEHHYLLDPHTAVGWAVAERYYNPAEGVPLLLAATASPYKFPAAVLQALGRPVAGMDGCEQLQSLQEYSGLPVSSALAAVASLVPRPRRVVEIEDMPQALAEIMEIIV